MGGVEPAYTFVKKALLAGKNVCTSNKALVADKGRELMDIAREKARPGDAVLLSPACASWGMFKNYEVRGKVFKEIVRKFKG